MLNIQYSTCNYCTIYDKFTEAKEFITISNKVIINKSEKNSIKITDFIDVEISFGQISEKVMK